MKIKVCGLTDPGDAELVVKFGATHIGCVMVPDAPRCIDSAQAKQVFSAAGRVVKILIFRAASPEAVLQTAKEAGTRHVQLHEYEEADAQHLEDKGLCVYRVFDVPTGTNILPPMVPTPTPKRPALLDVAGGASEITFPWEILGTDAPAGTFISGGVRAENVCALLTHHPYGIDISTGLEITPGRKDPDRLQLFFDTLERALA